LPQEVPECARISVNKGQKIGFPFRLSVGERNKIEVLAKQGDEPDENRAKNICSRTRWISKQIEAGCRRDVSANAGTPHSLDFQTD
jgi:hypothetical protein